MRKPDNLKEVRGPLCVGMRVILGGERYVKGTVATIDSSEDVTILRDDFVTGGGAILSELRNQPGWRINKKLDGTWGSSGNDGTLYYEIVSSWKKVIQK